MEIINLPLKIINQILAHAQSQGEEEICGLMAEKNGKAISTYPILNVSNQPECLYEMDPKAQIDAMRHMREKGESLYAIYHSHPHGAAYPSMTDVKEAQYPDVIYFIIALGIAGVLDLRAYRLTQGEIDVLQVQVCTAYSD